MDRQTDGRKDGWVSRSTALCRDTQEVPDSAPKSAPDLLCQPELLIGRGHFLGDAELLSFVFT